MSTDDPQRLVPEIYYDLIARVSAGVPLIVILASPTSSDLPHYSNAISVVVLLGLGYIAGHLLATISVLLNFIAWTPILWAVKKYAKLQHPYKSRSVFGVFSEVYERIDKTAKQDQNAGAMLKKMEAGAALTDNLLSAWLVLLVYSSVGGSIGWERFLEVDHKNLLVWSISAILVLSLWIRRFSLIVRQDNILSILDCAQKPQQP